MCGLATLCAGFASTRRSIKPGLVSPSPKYQVFCGAVAPIVALPPRILLATRYSSRSTSRGVLALMIIPNCWLGRALLRTMVDRACAGIVYTLLCEGVCAFGNVVTVSFAGCVDGFMTESRVFQP